MSTSHLMHQIGFMHGAGLTCAQTRPRDTGASESFVELAMHAYKDGAAWMSFDADGA